MVAGQDLIWQIIKKTSSKRFHQKQDGGVELSKERNNVANVNNYKYSGLARDEAVSVHVTGAKGNLVLRKKKKDQNKPNKRDHKIVVSKNGVTKRGTVVAKLTKGTFYRPDLTFEAVRRVARLQKVVVARRTAKKAAKKTEVKK